MSSKNELKNINYERSLDCSKIGGFAYRKDWKTIYSTKFAKQNFPKLIEL